MLKNKWKYLEEINPDGDGGGGGNPPAEPPAGDLPPAGDPPPAEPPKDDWSADWRERIAGGDEKALKQLSRFASPKALYESLVSTKTKLSQSRPLLGKDATPEQVAEYREFLGIPEKPEGYDVSGFAIKDQDKKFLENYLARAHATNQTNEQVRAGIQTYIDIANEINEGLHQRDSQIMSAAEEELREEWGRDFQRNKNLISSLLDSAPEGVKANLFRGRMADGTPIGSNAQLLRWLLSIELERNPTGTIVPGAGERMGETVADEISKIEKYMRTNRKDYEKDEKMQSRYRELIDWQLKNKKAA